MTHGRWVTLALLTLAFMLGSIGLIVWRIVT
jgi:hypothetical protein